MAYGDFNDSARRTASVKILLKIQNEMDIKEVLLQWIINFLIKKTSDLLTMSDQQLAEELNKSIIRKFKKRKVQSPFVDNIWGEF